METISRATQAVNSRLPNVIYKLDEPLKKHTSFKIGGSVRAMYFPESTDALAEICSILSEYGTTPFIMGNGSNILANDKDLDLIVVNTSKLCGIELVGAAQIKVQAGTLLSKLAVFAYENSLAGLEFAHGIPGTVGGAVVMNAGAYGGEMKDVVISTSAYNTSIGRFALIGEEHDFAYRHSRFSDTDDVVLSTVIRLQSGEKDSIKQKMDELAIRRRESQPLDLPSGGSTFKRPKDGYAAALIDQSGLKGFSIGGAQVSQKHAGFIVNYNNATFADTMEVIKHVQETVFSKFSIKLELEVKIIM